MKKKNDAMLVTGFLMFIFVLGTIFGASAGFALSSESRPVESVDNSYVVDKSNITEESPVKDYQTTPTEDEEETQRFVSLGMFEVTAYCPCVKCCGKSDGITASGVKAVAGRTVAADVLYLPFGTKVYIDGHEYTVEDTGGTITQKKLDIFFNNHEEALQYGRRQVEVFVAWQE